MTVLARALDWVEQGKVPDLSLVRRPARALTMAATLWQFPWMTARVVTAITLASTAPVAQALAVLPSPSSA